ncbi:MAG: hypothetical protein JOY67_05095 [Hyphomicrobiales bacterium]|nr:hypothetical protein [Hyphomicrobiales bacterium]
MNATSAILTAQALSLIAFGMFAFWYVVPWLRARTRAEALTSLIWVHMFRNLALQLYSAQQAGFAISDGARDHNVIGDVAGMLLALVTLISLRYRGRFSTVLVWLLIVETFWDIGTGMPEAIASHTLGQVSGVTWLILAYYVPLMIICLVLTIWQLMSRGREPMDRGGPAADLRVRAGA